jgi:hypothetical protein
MSIENWLPEYQNRVNTALEQFFATRYGATKGIEKEFEEALTYAVE